VQDGERGAARGADRGEIGAHKAEDRQARDAAEVGPRHRQVRRGWIEHPAEHLDEHLRQQPAGDGAKDRPGQPGDQDLAPDEAAQLPRVRAEHPGQRERAAALTASASANES
jgi:hypothetical protein